MVLVDQGDKLVPNQYMLSQIDCKLLKAHAVILWHKFNKSEQQILKKQFTQMAKYDREVGVARKKAANLQKRRANKATKDAQNATRQQAEEEFEGGAKRAYNGAFFVVHFYLIFVCICFNNNIDVLYSGTIIASRVLDNEVAAANSASGRQLKASAANKERGTYEPPVRASQLNDKSQRRARRQLEAQFGRTARSTLLLLASTLRVGLL